MSFGKTHILSLVIQMMKICLGKKTQDHQNCLRNSFRSWTARQWLQRSTELERTEERERQGTKWLTTKFVFDWRFRNGRWTRRARLVAREFRGQEVRNDTCSPATSASLVRLIPVLGLQQELSLYSVDVKDAFLQAPQRTPCTCHFPKGIHGSIREPRCQLQERRTFVAQSTSRTA